MSRNTILERDNFAAVRSILFSLYGEKFSNVSITPVNDGIRSYNYVLTAEDGQQTFFQLSCPGGAIKEEKYANTPLEFVQFLASHDISVPIPLRDNSGNLTSVIDTTQLAPDVAAIVASYRGILMTMVAGDSLPESITTVNGEPTYADYADQVGTIIGKIHAVQQISQFTTPVPQKLRYLSGAKTKMLDLFGLAPDTNIAHLQQQLQLSESSASQEVLRFSTCLRKNAESTNEASGRTLKKMADVIDEGWLHNIVNRMTILETLQDTIYTLPSGVCHGDCCNKTNFLQDNGKISAIIDFDEMFQGPLLWDVNYLMESCFTITDSKTRAFYFDHDVAKKTLRAYEKQRPLTDKELEMLPIFMEEYKVNDMMLLLEELSPFMRFNSLPKEDKAARDFGFIIYHYRHLGKIDQIAEMVQDYVREKHVKYPKN